MHCERPRRTKAPERCPGSGSARGMQKACHGWRRASAQAPPELTLRNHVWNDAASACPQPTSSLTFAAISSVVFVALPRSIRVLLEEDGVLDVGVAGAHGTLHEDYLLCPPDLDHGHTGQWVVVAALLCAGVCGVVGAHDEAGTH